MLQRARLIGVVSIFGSCSLGQLFGCELGLEHHQQELTFFERSIIGGDPDTSSSHQAIAFLRIVHQGSPDAYLCSGTLISPRVILTAAHCAENYRSIEIGFGDDRYDLTPAYFSEVRIHDGWDDPADGPPINDLALIRLTEPPAGITPIPTLPASLGIQTGEEGKTELQYVGFGLTENNTSGVKMVVTDMLEHLCTSSSGCVFQVTSTKHAHTSNGSLCNKMDPEGTCGGDSGGPALVTRNGTEYVAGVTSYGDEYCLYYGCSNRTDWDQVWILSFIQQANGALCTFAEECVSGYCVNSVCCNAACSGACASCNQPGQVGICLEQNCEDDNPCTQDSCQAGQCLHQTRPDGSECSDLNECNGLETCQDGQCTPGTALQCGDGNPCTDDRCNPERGCQSEPAADGSPCSDGNDCNGEDFCQNGICENPNPTTCDDQNPCTQDSCPDGVGCVHSPWPDGTSCDNQNRCDGAETCQAGQCVSEAPLSCEDDNPCTENFCDPNVGCDWRPHPEGSPCSDGDACTIGDSCSGGRCQGSSSLDCEDNDPCTLDLCDPEIGCTHPPTCDDQNPCTADVCKESGCQSYQVADGTPCENESCPSGTCLQGICVNSESCDEDLEIQGSCACTTPSIGPGGWLLLVLAMIFHRRAR